MQKYKNSAANVHISGNLQRSGNIYIVKGFTSCDKKLLEVGTVFEYSERQKFFRIVLPYAMADILVGMRIGHCFCRSSGKLNASSSQCF